MDACPDCAFLIPSITIWTYVLAAVAASLAIRFLTSLLRAWRAKVEDDAPFWRALGRLYVGLGPRPLPASSNPDERKRLRGDYFGTGILGALELLAYPVLLKAGMYAYVGAWIGLKALAQYETWKADREAFRLFLIANALAVILSFWISLSLLDYSDDTLTTARAVLR